MIRSPHRGVDSLRQPEPEGLRGPPDALFEFFALGLREGLEDVSPRSLWREYRSPRIPTRRRGNPWGRDARMTMEPFAPASRAPEGKGTAGGRFVHGRREPRGSTLCF